MNNKQPFAILSAVLALALAALACAGGGAAPTSAPTQAPTVAAPTQAAQPTTAVAAATDTQPATAAPTTAPTESATKAPTSAPTVAAPTKAPLSGSLDLHGISSYEDSNKEFRVVGLLTNGTDKPVSNIQLSLALKDSTGKTVLKDDSGNPTSTVTSNSLLNTIASGETSPFEFFQSTNGADTSSWKAKVAIASSENATDLQRTQVVVANNVMNVASDGDVYLTGELVNQSDQPAQISSFAGALLDASGNVAAAASYQDVTRLLSPAGDAQGTDRTPFVIHFYGPVKPGATPNFYVDAIKGSASDISTAANVHLKLVNSFVDSNNDVHVLATVTNNGTTSMTVQVVAGLYDQSGKVLDGSSANAPVDLLPGASSPVALYSFTSLNGNTDLINKVVSYTAQIDPYWTFAVTSDIVELVASNVTTTVDGTSLTIKGDVVNTSNKPLNSATVVVLIHDASGNLVTADYTSAAPNSGAFAPKSKQSWSVTTELPSKVDPSTIKVDTIVQGNVKS